MPEETLPRIEALARFVFAALAMLFGLPEAMAQRPLDKAEFKLARAWVRELERFTRGLVYALALAQPFGRLNQGHPSPSGGGAGVGGKRDGAGARSIAHTPPPQPSPRRGEGAEQKGEGLGFRLSSPVHGGGGRKAAGGLRGSAQPLASALFATERLAARYAAAEHVLANPQPLARRLARRWARDAARKARDLARAATAPPKSHVGKPAPYRSGDFEAPLKGTLRRVLLYEQRCALAAALAGLAPVHGG